MNHPNQHLYPIVCHEFGTRYFDESLIEAVATGYKEAQEFFMPDEELINWSAMSLLDQVIAQISFIAPPPRRLSEQGVIDELTAEEALAKRVVAEIEAINDRHPHAIT